MGREIQLIGLLPILVTVAKGNGADYNEIQGPCPVMRGQVVGDYQTLGFLRKLGKLVFCV